MSALPVHASRSSMAPRDDADMATLKLCGIDLQLDHAGALWWPEERTLTIADMHLEKGSAFATRGQLLPPYDSALTVASLNRLVARHKPRRLIALGDSFHDVRAGERMDEACRTALTALAAGLEMIWITGNHDPEIPEGLPGLRLNELMQGPLIFRHEPRPRASKGEIAGHLHPVAKVVTDRGRVRRRAFVTDGARLLMPAFGAYAGGLNLCEPVIQELFGEGRITAHVCGQTRVYAMGMTRLYPD